MITRQTVNNLVWIDLESPEKDEIREIMEEYKIHPVVAEDIIAPTLKPRLDVHENFIYMVLHFPALKHTHKTQKNQEVDFIVGKDFLITVHYDTIDPLHKFSKVLEVSSILKKAEVGEHAGFLFYYVIRKLYRALVHELEYISDQIESIENRIFEGEEKEMVEEISKVSRDLLDFKHVLGLHHYVLESFKEAGPQFFGTSFSHHARSIMSEYMRVDHILRSNVESIIELRETNNSLVSTKQNEVMKVLTIMAFVTFPLSLFASLFGMNTTYLPFVGLSYDFWIIVSIMLIAMTFFFGWFKYKRWL
jgi:magnesium transporter